MLLKFAVYYLLVTTASETPKSSPLDFKMEELRSAVIKLQKNFRELVNTDNAIKDGINCNTKNLEALKNLTLDIQERVSI